MKYSYIIFISCAKHKIESKEPIPALYYFMSVRGFLLFFFNLQKNSATALIPYAFLYLSLAFPSPSNFSFQAVTESFSGYLNSFIHHFRWWQEWVPLTIPGQKEARQLLLPQAPCSSPAPGAAAATAFARGTTPPGQDKLLMATNHSFTQTPFSCLCKGQSSLLCPSPVHTGLWESLAILQPLLYSSGTSELMFHKVATKLEGKFTWWQHN